MFTRYTISLFLPLLILSAFRTPAAAQVCDSIDTYQQETNLRKVSEGNLSFGLRFFQTLNQLEDKSRNRCVSPFSVVMALSMTLNGAEGETLEQMKTTLGLSRLKIAEINCAYRNAVDVLENAGTDLQFESANSIWIRQDLPVNEDFIAVNRAAYDAEVAALDFSDSKASKTINAWVKEQTKGKIEEIVPKNIGQATMMYLINAIYFKGMWAQEFDKEATKKESFTLPGGTKIKHEMMKVEGDFPYRFLRDSTQVINLRYKTQTGTFNMVIILPPQGKEINEFVGSLNEDFIEDIFNSRAKNEGTLYLPKFKLEQEELLNDALIGMGMERPFNRSQNPEVGAEFNGISPQQLYISKVRQKTFVEVNEEGTEAAAVTAVEMDMPLSPAPARLPFVMRVDRPFLFLITSSNPDAILFFGKIIDPRRQ